MCDFDEWVFRCGHSAVRLKSYCHDARNAPGHRCYFVKRLKNVWYQQKECEECTAKRMEGQWAQPEVDGNGECVPACLPTCLPRDISDQVVPMELGDRFGGGGDQQTSSSPSPPF